MTATAFGWLAQHGPRLYVGVLLVAMVDATGVPLPGRVLLIAAGALAHDWGQVAAMIGAATLGAVAGDHVWYMAGRVGSDRLMALYCKLSLVSGRCKRRARSHLDRFGPLAIVIGRFFAGVRIASAPMVAIGAVSYPRYLVFEVIGAILWSAVFILLGHVLGQPWRAIMGRFGVGTVLAVVGGLVVLGVAAIVALRLLRRRRHGQAETEHRGRRPGRRGPAMAPTATSAARRPSRSSGLHPRGRRA
ncbi:MAG TPA: DedA family protein [Methylomirabilota bacterium]|nr:DedA family protein [Methylomirabilota bacterium]